MESDVWGNSDLKYDDEHETTDSSNLESSITALISCLHEDTRPSNEFMCGSGCQLCYILKHNDSGGTIPLLIQVAELEVLSSTGRMAVDAVVEALYPSVVDKAQSIRKHAMGQTMLLVDSLLSVTKSAFTQHVVQCNKNPVTDVANSVTVLEQLLSEARHTSAPLMVQKSIATEIFKAKVTLFKIVSEYQDMLETKLQNLRKQFNESFEKLKTTTRPKQ